ARPFGISYQEHEVDTGGLTLEQGLQDAAEALAEGVVIPAALGPRAGEHRRYALILQAQKSGRSRAFQLYEPFSQEVVWVHQKDLLARTELPLGNKAYRRITALALPRAR